MSFAQHILPSSAVVPHLCVSIPLLLLRNDRLRRVGGGIIGDACWSMFINLFVQHSFAGGIHDSNCLLALGCFDGSVQTVCL